MSSNFKKIINKKNIFIIFTIFIFLLFFSIIFAILNITNEKINNGIRNSIAHGNYKVIQKETLKDSLIEFTDFYEGKITFKASISIDNFVEFLHKSAIEIEKYLSKEEKLVLGN